ncbi:MAG TPA: sugar phosphate isomerase/epimerase [Gemmatimonadaceae bacterium]|nr:sugar phosphate isomerase/epimerase [Gemmatimonadaceae bacterium]
MTHRRDFLKFLGATAAAGALMPKTTLASGVDLLSADAAAVNKVGVQLYTVRGAMEKEGVDKILARIAAIGYKEVEFAGYYGRSAAQIRAALEANGLTSPSVHVPLQQLTAPDFPKFVADAKLIGHKWINLAWLAPPDRGSVEKYNSHADALLKAQQVAKAAGITIGYHNHEFEFDPLGNTNGYEILLERTKGSGVVFEMDLYWMSVAGKDPVSYWTRFPGRFPMVHVKDNGGKPGNEIRPVGAGTIDWAALFAKRNVAGIKHFYVEHDNPADPFVSITESYAYLKKLRFA